MKPALPARAAASNTTRPRETGAFSLPIPEGVWMEGFLWLAELSAAEERNDNMIDKMLADGWVVVNLNSGDIRRECFTKAEALSELQDMRNDDPQEAEACGVDRARNWNGMKIWGAVA